MMLIDEEETRNASRHQIEVIPFTIITIVKYNYNENKVDVEIFHAERRRNFALKWSTEINKFSV